MKFETLAIHTGAEVDEATGAVVAPIHLSTTFARDESLALMNEYQYIRDGNPTQTRTEEALAAIDSGRGALLFASGLAAGAAVLQSLRGPWHVVLPDDCYYGVRVMVREYGERWGITSELVDMSDPDNVGRAIRGEKTVVWSESPSNPLMKVVDIAAISDIAHRRGALSLVDGTFATPALQRPIELGADVVLHSATKYLGGHSDVQGGVLVFRERNALFDRVRETRHHLGAVASPFNAWLIGRGIRTLAARMRLHCDNAASVAGWLARHPNVERVFYPGLAAHPGHQIAARQMSCFGGMLSFNVKGGREAAMRVVSLCRLFTRATSLGGTESLIEHRATSEGESSQAPPQLIRVSVGLEHVDDLIADLEQALSDGKTVG